MTPIIEVAETLSTRAFEKVDEWLRHSLPGPCSFCLSPALPGRAWCRSCLDALPWNVQACRQCGEPLPAVAAERCGRCLSQPPAFNWTFAGLRYDAEIVTLMHRFKFSGKPRAGVVLASLMLETLKALPQKDMPQTLVALPRHPSRAREFGFDQAAWLTTYLSRHLGIVEAKAHRVRHTPTQRGLDRRARQRNLRNAFRIDGPLTGRVAVVDDIMTTGASLDELARACLTAGADEVLAWAIARTPPATAG
ncbi:comF family protein [Modicisalibacter xianhensis]|uniref:ComF family protein n=1 Tax=Modicisalibacter xianhensis TaxID=442341 RepID=A0A1I3BR07_9GAMM|nr:comF family protein [Halomonas xianhensis]